MSVALDRWTNHYYAVSSFSAYLASGGLPMTTTFLDPLKLSVLSTPVVVCYVALASCSPIRVSVLLWICG